MKLTRTVVRGCAAAVVLTSCSGGGDGGSGAEASGGTFTYAVSSDPGALDPQMSAGTILGSISRFAYDSLVNLSDDGKIVSGLAEEWTVDGTTVSMTLADGITCTDGSDFTASDAADNLNYIADPENGSPLLGIYLPVGAQATGSDDGTLTIELPAPAPFVLRGLSGLPMVCADGLADRSILAQETHGTGPYELTEAVPDDHYTFQLRDGYTWGPDGASTDEQGMPDEVVVRVVTNETTLANQLLSGEVNGGTVTGRDAQRLDEAGLYSTAAQAVAGEMWFNHAEARVTSDPAVREALTRAVDLGELADVLTAGQGGPGTTFSTLAPVACEGNSIADALPEYDVDAAQQLLDDAGWSAGDDGIRSKDGQRLAVTFTYATSLGSGGAAAAELVGAAWTELGIDVTATAQDETASLETLFSTGDWDVTWTPLNVGSPDQLVPFLSGPVAPDGNNFAGISNPEYDALVAQATAQEGDQGCENWLAAESRLVEDSSVIPFANSDVTYFGNKAEFELTDALVPTSIQLTD